MKQKFIDKNSDKLIIFLTGWGCDDNQFDNMNKANLSYDILLYWDYTSLDFDFIKNLNKYKTIYLIAYSAGVFVAGLLQNKLPKITKSIAINGNPFMFDKHFGISVDTLNILYNLNLDNYIDFRKLYLVKNQEELEFFNAHASLRSFESCYDELKALENYSKLDYKPYNFDIALLSDDDKIFNPKTQLEYFKEKSIILEQSAHNVFYRFKKYEDIISKVL